MRSAPMLVAVDRCDDLAGRVKDMCDMDETAVAAGLWHAVEGLRVLARMGRADAVEAVLARVLEALDEDIA